MTFDPIFDVSTVVGFFGCIGTVAYFGFRISGEIRALQLKVDMLWRWFTHEHGINGSRHDAPEI